MAKIFNNSNDFKKFLIDQGKEDFLTGEYLNNEADSFISKEAQPFLKDLQRAAIENGKTVGKFLDKIENHLNNMGYNLQIIDNGDNEYTLAYVKNINDTGKMSNAEINETVNNILGDINIPKFKFGLPRQNGLTKHSSQSEINQRVFDATEKGVAIAYSRIEKLFDEQEKKLARQESNFIKAMKEGKMRTAANSVKWTTNKVMNKMPATGGFRVDDELWKARQGTGSKQNLMVRKNYLDLEPIIDNIIKQSPGLVKGYRKQNNKYGSNNINYGSTFERTKEYIKQNIMQIFAQYGARRNLETIEKELHDNKAYDYLRTNEFAREFIKEYGKKIHELQPYIGTSQENSLNHYLVSLLPNAALGYMGGLDDKSSRKRVQVANTLSTQKVNKNSINARLKNTIKGVAFTKEQRELGEISSDDLDQRLFGIIYATNDEIQKAQREVYKELKAKKVRNAARRAGLGTGAHSGGVFYNHDIERAFDATQARNKNLLEEDIIKETKVQLERAQKDKKKMSEGAARTQAIKRLLAREIDADVENILLNGKGSERILDGKKSYDFSFYEKRNMATGNKLLTDAEYDRLTGTATDRRVFEKILINRELSKGVSIDKAKEIANSLIDKYKIGLLKQTSGIDYRNISGYAQDYMNVLLHTFISNKGQNGKISDKDIQSILGHKLLNGWFTFDKNKQEFVTQKQREFNNPQQLLDFINDLNDLSNSNIMGDFLKGHNLNNVFTVDKDGNVNIDFSRFVGLTGANQFNGYHYGTPDSVKDSKIMRADYRWKGAVKRTLGVAAMGTGQKMDLLYDAIEESMKGDSEDQLSADKQKRLSENFQKNLEKTRKSREKTWKAASNDLLLAYGAMGGDYEAYEFDGNGNLKPITEGKKGYIDLSKNYQEVVGRDTHGNIVPESYTGSLTQMIDLARKNQNGTMYLLPGMKNGVSGFKVSDGSREISGQALALTGILDDMFSKKPGDGEGRLDKETNSYRYSELDSSITRLAKKEQEYQEAYSKYNETLSEEDKEILNTAEEELSYAIADYEATTHDLINNKNGSIFQWRYNKLNHSAMLSAQSSMLPYYKDQNGKFVLNPDNLFEGSSKTSGTVFMNKEDLATMIRKTSEETDEQHAQALKGQLEYMYGKDYANVIKKYDRDVDINDIKSLEEFVLNSVLKDSEVYKRRLKHANGEPLRGLFGLAGRFPFSEGLDSKYAEVFAGGKDHIGKGEIRVDLGLGKSFNADFDGDKLVFHLASASGGFGSKYGANGTNLIDQARAAVDFQNAVNLPIGMFEFLDLMDGNLTQTLEKDDIAKMFNDRAQAAGALASRLNKGKTGQLSNLYQIITESMGEIDPRDLMGANDATKEQFLNQMLIRNLFSSFTQDAISSKKVFARMAKKYGAQEGSEDFLYSSKYLQDVDDLMTMLRDPENYKSGPGIKNIILKARDMGILGDDSKGLFSDRITSTFLAYAQNMYAGTGKNFTGLNDKNFIAMADALGIDESRRQELFDSMFTYNADGTIDSSKYLSGEKGLFKIIGDDLVNGIIKHQETTGKNIGYTLRDAKTYLPGGISAINNPLYRLGNEVVQAGTEEYDKLAENLKLPGEGYDNLANSANNAKEAIEAEAAAEKAKIGIANQEGKAISNLSSEYADLQKQVKKTTSVQEAYLKKEEKLGKMVDQRVTVYSQSLFPSRFKDTDQVFNKNIIDKIEDPTYKVDLLKNDKEIAKSLKYEDGTVKQFQDARNSYMATRLGVIADAVEEVVVEAVKNGVEVDPYNINSFEDLQKKVINANPHMQEFAQYDDGRRRGISALFAPPKDGKIDDRNDFDRIMQVLYGKDYTKVKDQAVQAGMGLYRQNLMLAGGDINNIGGSEAQVFNILSKNKGVVGHYDRLIFGTKKVPVYNPETGKSELEERDAIFIPDKKFAHGVSDAYPYQGMMYARAFELIRDQVLKSSAFDPSMWKDNKDGVYRKNLYDTFFETTLGKHYSNNPEDENYLEQSLFERIIGRQGKGSIMVPAINLIKKATGKGAMYEVGKQSYEHVQWTGNAKIDKEIDDYIANGVNFNEWNPEIQKAYKQNSYVEIAGINANAYDVAKEAKPGKNGRQRKPSSLSRKAVFDELKNSYDALLKAYKEYSNRHEAIEETVYNGIAKDSEEYKILEKQLIDSKEELGKKETRYKNARDRIKKKKSNGRKSYTWNPDYDKYDLIVGENGIIDYYGSGAAGNDFIDIDRKNIKKLSRAEFLDVINNAKARDSVMNQIHEYFSQQAKVEYDLWENEQKRAKNKDSSKEPYFDIIKDNLTRQKEMIAKDILHWQTMYATDDEFGEAFSKAYTTEEGKSKDKYNYLMAQYMIKQRESKEAQKKNSPGFLGFDAYTMRWVDRLVYGGAIMTFFARAKRGLTDLTNKAKQLDKAMTNLRIVTGENADNARNLIGNYAQLGKEIGATALEVTQSATAWLRQGYNVAEVNDLVTSTMYLSKLGMIDATTATTAMTSALKGFKLEATDAMSVVDKLTALDVKAATTAGDIATGLAQFANLASLSGVSIDQASAYVATIADVNQKSGGEVGQSLKTIMSRYGNVKAGVYNKMNVDSETQDSGEQINDVEKVLNKLGITMRDTNLQFKDFDQVLDEIAIKWETLDTVSKKAIANAFAGVRQQEAFLVLLNNYDKYQDLLEVSKNSKGTAERKYESYKESYEASKNALTAALEEFANSSELNNVLITLTDIGKNLVEGLKHIIPYIPAIVQSISHIRALSGNSTLEKVYSRMRDRGLLFGEGGTISATGKMLSRRTRADLAGKRADVYHERAEQENNLKRKEKYEQRALKLEEKKRKLIEKADLKEVKNAEKKKDLSNQEVQNEQNRTNQTEQQEQNAVNETNQSRQQVTNEQVKKNLEDQQVADEQKKKNLTDQQVANTAKGNGAAGAGAGAGKVGGKASVAFMAASMVASTAMSSISQFATAGTSHTNHLGDTVSSSKDAQKAGGGAAAIAAWIPIIGSWLAPTIGSAVAAAVDKERDIANATTENANKNISGLKSLDSRIKEIQTSGVNSAESMNSAAELLKEMFSYNDEEEREEKEKTRKLLENYLGKSIYSVLSDIKNNTENSAEAFRELRLAQIKSERGQIAGKYSSQLKSSSDRTLSAYANQQEYGQGGRKFANTALGVVAGGAIGAGAGAAIGAGTALAGSALVSTGLMAAGAANAWNPVGWIALIAGIIGATIGGVAASQASDALEEKWNIEDARGTEWNTKTLSEKLDTTKEALEKAEREGNDEQVNYLSELCSSLEEQIGLSRQINEEINNLTLEAAMVSAHIGDQYLEDMTVAQMKNVGVGELINAYAKAVEKEGGLLGKNIWTDSEQSSLTRSGYDYLFKKLRSQDNEKINAVLSGESFTLNEALRLSRNPVYASGENQRWINAILQNFANSLGLSVSDLSNQAGSYGKLTLADTYIQASEIGNTIKNYTDLMGSIASGSGDVSAWMTTIINQFPDLIQYMDDTSTLFTEMGDKLQQFAASQIATQFKDIASSSEFYESIKDVYYEQLRADGNSDLIAGLEAFGDTGVTTIEDIVKYATTTGDKEAVETLKKILNGRSLTSQYLKDFYNELTSAQDKVMQAEIDNLTQQRDALKEINSQREYENKLIEARNKLEDASKNKKRVYRAGVGFVYEADQEAILNAQKDLESLQKEKQISELDDYITYIKSEKEAIDTLVENMNTETQVKNLNAWMEENSKGNGFFEVLKNGVLGISEKMTKLLDAEVENKEVDKNEAFDEAKRAWDTLTESSSISDYNTNATTFHDYANAAKKAGVSDEELKAAFGDFTYKKGNQEFTVNGYSLMSGSLADVERDVPYNVVVAYDGTRYEGSASNEIASTKNMNYILGDLKDGKGDGVIWNREGKVLYEGVGNSIFRPRDDEEEFYDYINRLVGSGEIPVSSFPLIVSGFSGYDESVLVDKNGNVYAIKHPKNSDGLEDVGKSDGKEYGVQEAAAYGSLGLRGGLSLINELGTEAIITPSGTITALPSGTGVVPADVTKNLWQLGEMAPEITRLMTARIIPDMIGRSAMTTNNDESINIQNIEMKVDADSTFDVNKFVDSVRARAALTRNTRN